MCEAVCSVSSLSWLLSPLQFLCLGGGGGEGDCYDPADLEILIFCLILIVCRTGWVSLHQTFTVFHRGFIANYLVFFILGERMFFSCMTYIQAASLGSCQQLFSTLFRNIFTSDKSHIMPPVCHNRGGQCVQYLELRVWVGLSQFPPLINSHFLKFLFSLIS